MRANLSEEVAQRTMLEAVYLAEEARTLYREENPNAGEIKIALSLGPFGSTISPGQEYDGFYPLPYGPMGFLDDGEKTNSFGQDVERESASIDALAKFHLDRLVVFCRDPKAWSAIDIVAFETVPLVREVKAIRKTMAQLVHPLGANNLKPWWISCVFPKGKCPEEKCPGGPNLTARDVVAAALCGGHGPVPTAIGVNCTSPDLLPTLVNEMTLATQDCCGTDGASPWLVLYPNNGDLYDPIRKTWKVEEKEQEHKWEADLAKIVMDLSEDCTGIWSGFLVGGCCQTGPMEIRGLRDRFLKL